MDKKGFHASMQWLENRKDERGDIRVYFPEAKSVISVGLNYYVGKNQVDLNLNINFQIMRGVKITIKF